jgi:hypothetical protein
MDQMRRKVVQAYREEEIGDVHGDVDGQSHIREVEAVRREDQGECDYVVSDQFFEVFSWFLEAHQENNHLLRPVGGLHEVVCLKNSVVCFVWESLEHAGSIEIPDWCPRHNV